MKPFLFMLLFLLILALPACSNQNTMQGRNNSSAERPSVLEDGVWPDNVYTEGLAVPPGTVDWAVLDTAKGYCAVFLVDVTEEEYRAYMDLLEEDGFFLVQEVSEEVKGQNGISIGTVLSDRAKELSISYVADGLGIYISLITEPDA